MIPVIAGIESVVLAGLAIWLAWRRTARDASPGILAAIASLLVAQALVANLFVFQVVPAAWRPGQGIAPALLWLFGALRAGPLLWAFALWFAISRESLSRGWAAVLALAFIGGVWSDNFPSLAAAALLLWLSGRSSWTQSLQGTRRVVVLLGSLLLLVLLSAWPQALVRDGVPHPRFVPLFVAPGGPLFAGDAPASFADGLAIARPFDRLAGALLQLFRAQLLVLVIRAITLPIRLYGMSLKRRFLVNYILIRSIPSVLASLTLLVVIYFAVGVSQATRAREAFESTLARADASAQAL